MSAARGFGLSTLLTALASALAACGTPQKWDYTPGAAVRFEEAVSPLRLAVHYPEDGRSNASDMVLLESMRSGEGHYGSSHSPHCLIVGRAIYEELAASRAFAAVAWEPVFTEDFDYRLRSRLLAALGGPTVLDVWLEAQEGREVGRLRVVGTLERDPTVFEWRSKRKKANALMAETVETILPWLASTLLEELARRDASQPSRARRYYELLDPELTRFRAEMTERGRKEGAEKDPTLVDLARAYTLKTAILESLRLTEAAAEENIQKAKGERADAFFEAVHKVIKEGQARHIAAVWGGIAAGAMAGMANSLATDPSFASDPVMAQSLQQVAVATQLSLQQSFNPVALQAIQTQVTQAALAQDEEILRSFRAVRGTILDVRDRWLDKYFDKTPSLSDVLKGKWPPKDAAPGPKKGGVTIKSDPSDAEVFINGNFFGNTPTRDLTFPLGSKLDIVVRAKGREDYRKAVDIVSENILELSATLAEKRE